MSLRKIPFLLSAIALLMTRDDTSALSPASRQCLVVTTDSWGANHGRMFLFERTNGRTWVLRGSPIPVVLGEAGLGWGRGLINPRGLSGPVKKEGDNRAPAGVFRLSSAFGYAQENPGTRLFYLALSRNVVAVDDPKSRYYNQLVDQRKIARPDWRSAENMILNDDRYKWGIVVDHNVPPRPGAGSCIFVHVWKSPATTTTGCTATPETDILRILRWLDPTQHPLLVQIPAPIYGKVRSRWGLPMLPEA